jgi:acetyl-CoA carboxylase carboxyl transferase subunit alpha
VYSVITVEGCAAILWKDGKSPEMREKAASALRITAPDLFELKVIDEIIPEPKGGAHADHQATAAAVHDVLCRHLEVLPVGDGGASTAEGGRHRRSGSR